MFIFDPLYFLLAAPALMVMFYAQARVRSAYGKYSRIRNLKGITGLEAARLLLRTYGLDGVKIEKAEGLLTDHYDPRHKALRFSEGIYASPSVASLGIVAHEVGHALQHHQGYFPMKVRTALVPIANIGSYLGYIFFILGIIIGIADLVWLGVFLFSGAVAFALATLPVEFDASRKAKLMLKGIGLISKEEERATSDILSAAALTYVAALLQAIANFFYFLLTALGMRRE